MTKPAGINAQLAITCEHCNERILAQAYPDENHEQECAINKFLAVVEKDKLKRIDISSDLSALLATAHGLPFTECQWPIPNGVMRSLYAPNWLSEAVIMYDNMHMDGMDIGDFLRSLAP